MVQKGEGIKPETNKQKCAAGIDTDHSMGMNRGEGVGEVEEVERG